jgi:uncharacterized protein YkwD
MRRACVLGLLCAVSVAALAGCDELVPARHQTFGCSAEGQSCGGARDCFATCACEEGGPEGCERECSRGSAPRVSDLDESDWEAEAQSFEQEVLALTNQARAEGGCCGNEGCFSASGPLRSDAALTTAARAHAKDMAERDYFDHVTPEGLDPFDRMREAGYQGCAMGENIAAGQPTPQSVMDDWMSSDGHCGNILQPSFELLGVGYYERDEQTEWVQNFGG